LLLSGLLVTSGFGSAEKEEPTTKKKFSLVAYENAMKGKVSTENSMLRDVSVSFRGTQASSRDVGLSFLKTTTSIGGEMEVFLSSRFSLALGAEFRSNSPSDARLSAGTVSTQFLNGNSAFEAKASLIPILGTVRFNVPFHRFRAYFGAGAGLYIGKLRINWQSPDFADERFYAKGMAIIPHFNSGLSYKLSKRISVGFDVRYVMGSLNSMTIKECLDSAMVGQKLSLSGIDTYSSQFPWEMKGLNMGFKVRFNF
jgi:hypothetical protein